MHLDNKQRQRYFDAKGLLDSYSSKTTGIRIPKLDAIVSRCSPFRLTIKVARLAPKTA